MRPLFSIIIPTHNRASLLTVAIDSVLQQRYKNWELLIIDDGSTDETKQAVTQYDDDRIRYYYQIRQERSTARNRGIGEAQGRYICFLDDDDYYLEQHLSNFYAYLHQHDFPTCILRTGYYQLRKRRRYPTALYRPKKDGHPVKWAAFHFCGVWSLCIPKRCLEQHLFPPEFRHWQDTHLILRLLATYPFRQLPTYSYVYVLHPTMGSKTIYQFEDAEQRIQSNVDAILDLFDRYGPVLSEYLPAHTRDYLVAEKYLGHANGALTHGHLKLGFALIRKSWRYNNGRWFMLRYAKLIMKLWLYKLKYLTV